MLRWFNGIKFTEILLRMCWEYFPGSLLLGGASDCTSTGTLHCPCSIAGGPHSPVLDNVFQSGESSSVSNSLPSVVGVESRNQSHIGESGHLRTHLKFELHSMPNLRTHSLPEYQDNLANGPSFGSPSNMATSISSRTPEILDNHQFRRIISTGQSSELKEGNKRHGPVPFFLMFLY